VGFEFRADDMCVTAGSTNCYKALMALSNESSAYEEISDTRYYVVISYGFSEDTYEFEKVSDQTLYSFRHSGAIEIFKRTGSITKLQKAMGHSSINVSLTYLRGLEIAELKEEDMPMV
jgi:integrase